MGSYKPRYDDDQINRESDQVNVSGRSPRANLTIEERAQRQVASEWLIAQECLHDGDSKDRLEALGFTDIVPKGGLFYSVTPPAGWTKSTNGLWTTILDEQGRERISQFFKGASYDTRAFMSFKSQE